MPVDEILTGSLSTIIGNVEDRLNETTSILHELEVCGLSRTIFPVQHIGEEGGMNVEEVQGELVVGNVPKLTVVFHRGSEEQLSCLLNLQKFDILSNATTSSIVDAEPRYD